MNIRESMEERELELLCPYAAYSGKSREETARRKSAMCALCIKGP